MSYRTIYCIVQASSTDDACTKVSSILDDTTDNWFDSYSVRKKDIIPTYAVGAAYVNALTEAVNKAEEKTILSLISRLANEVGKNVTRGEIGDLYKRLGRIMSEDFCFDCPFFNFSGYDYSWPVEAGFYAVPVEFHY